MLQITQIDEWNNVLITGDDCTPTSKQKAHRMGLHKHKQQRGRRKINSHAVREHAIGRYVIANIHETLSKLNLSK